MRRLTIIVQARKALIVPILLPMVITLFSGAVVHADFAPDVVSGYNAMPSSLPDDRGLYGSSTTAKYRDSPINRKEGRVGQPLSDNKSHQYLTVAGGAINDESGTVQGQTFRDLRIKIYTMHPESAKTLNFRFVDRKVNISEGSEANVADCSADLEIRYINSRFPGAGDKVTSAKSPPTCALSIDAKNKFPDIGDNPDFFQPLLLGGRPTGIYFGIVSIHLKESARQASFNISSPNDVKFGYEGINSFDRSIMGGGEYFFNMYGTKLADHHQYKFYWKPPCEVATDVQYLNTPLYDNVDQGHAAVQPDTPFAARYRNNAKYGSNITNLKNQEDGGGDPLMLPYGQHGPSDPFNAYVTFNNMNGGNGIGFAHPYDSASYFLPCPTTQEWELSNDTTISGSAAGYDNANDGVSNRQKRAVDFFRSYTFTHSVQNLPGNNLSPSSANSEVQVFMRRGDKTDDSWSGIFGANSATMSNRLPGGGSQSVSRKADESQLRTSPSGGNFSLYESNTRPPVAKGAWCAARNVTAANPNPSPPASPGHCTIPDGAAWRYDRGDAYCEKVITNNFSSSRPGQTLNRPNPDGAYGPDSIKCIELTTSPGACYSNPWNVTASGTIREIDGANTYGSGMKDYADARVGSTYDTLYVVERGALSGNTGNINGQFTMVEHDGASLGGWVADGADSAFLLPDGGNNYKNISKRTVYINAQSGGKTFYSHARFSPTVGNADCTSGGVAEVQTSLYVPYFFNITPDLANLESSTEQGEPIDAKATYNLPLANSEGRQHTHTDNTNHKITKIVNPPSTTAAARDSNDDNPCSYTGGQCSATPITSAGHLMPNGAANDSLGNLPISATETATMPIGTKVCFVASLQRPTQEASPTWRHSAMRCTTIVKRPKVQFLNGDLTVGRAMVDNNGICNPASANSNAIIKTSGAPAYINPTDNSYGSWIEYGAFATGNINGFGSGAVPARGSTTQFQRLLFTNTLSSPGNYRYANPCLADAFAFITNDATQSNTIDGSITNIRPGDYFSAPGRNTIADDKLGYKTELGKDLSIGEPAPTDPGASAPGTAVSSGGTYVVSQCNNYTTSPPVGWTGSGNTYSPGCSSDGNYLKVRQGAFDQLTTSSYTFTAPENTKIQRLQADRIMNGAPGQPYRDTYSKLDADGAEIESCTRYFGCENTSGAIDRGLNAQSLNMYTFCSVQRVPAGIYYPTSGGENIGCFEGETSYALKNIRLTLQDNSAPTLNDVKINGVPVSNPASTTIKGSPNLGFVASDSGSGVWSYSLTATSGGVTKTLALNQYIDPSNSNCANGSSTVSTPTPCPGLMSKNITFDSSTLEYGTYNFSLTLKDKSGNSAEPVVWKSTVDNRNLLGSDYNYLSNRNIVIYARKSPNLACGQAGAGGNLIINTDIIYKMTGYQKISELPRIMMLADCDIVIDDGVAEVSAWLVARRDILTCSRATAAFFRNPTTEHPSQADCSKRLTVNGALQANRLLLMRTHGADLTNAAERSHAAEVFNLRPDQVLSTWAKGQTNASNRVIYEVDLPPRY